MNINTLIINDNFRKNYNFSNIKYSELVRYTYIYAYYLYFIMYIYNRYPLYK